MINETLINLTGQTLGLGSKVDYVDIFRNYVYQIDDKIMICIMVILTCEVLCAMVMPRVIEGLEDLPFFMLIPYSSTILWIFRRIESISKDLSMCCAMLIWYIYCLQHGFTRGYMIWTGILGGIIIIIIISIVIGYIRNWNKPKEEKKEEDKHPLNGLMEKIKTVADGLEDDTGDLDEENKDSGIEGEAREIREVQERIN